jgi:uncharacterized membrane protein
VVQRTRHLAKALTWRIFASADTFLIAWLITGQIDWAASIATIEVVTKFVLYYLHERMWYRYINFGLKKNV